MKKISKHSAVISVLICVMFSLSIYISSNSKTSSIAILYSVALFFATAIPICYLYLIKKKNPWLILLFICVIMVNTGYLLLCCSKTLCFALWANRISYLGSVFLPLCMLMSVLRLSDIKYKKYLVYILFTLGFLVFLIAASPGYSDVYYKSVSLAAFNGVSYLEKEYGLLHIVYLFYLLSYFISMIAVMMYAKATNKLNDTVRAVFLIIAVFINIAVWFLEQLVHIEFELLSFSYIISEAFLLGLALLIQQNEKHIEAILKENIQKENPTVTEDEINYFEKGIKSLTKTEKIIFDYYILGCSTKEIREKINITENTLKYHNKNIYGKLGVSSRKQLISIYEFAKKQKDS